MNELESPKNVSQNSFHAVQLNRKTILPRQTGNSLGCHISVSWHLKSLVPIKVNPRLHWNQTSYPMVSHPQTCKKEVKTAVESCYGSVSTRLVFTSKRMLPVVRKDVLPAIQKSFVIYEYKCHCDSRYVGRTSQRLQDRIKQHVSQWLRQQLTRPRRSQPHRSCKRTNTKPDCDSAIGQHLLDNDRCALNYDDKRFSILAAARSSFHLNRLEATYIKTQRPVLCRQKEFVYTLKLFR